MSTRGSDRGAIVVLASGQGTNFRALCEAARSKRLPARIEALIVNVAGCGAVSVAREFGVTAHELPHAGLSREEHEARLVKVLDKCEARWLALAGYMRLFTPGLIRRFWDAERGAARIVNIHPSLLPSFPGVDGYAQAVRYGVRVTGATVHLVGEGLDDGPIVAQRALEVRDDDNAESLKERGLKLEHELYVDAPRRLLGEPWRLTRGAAGDGRPRVAWGAGR
jgi:phosphoribosylglycinamide formyltransferase-1